jgi:hypothetical protein
MVAKNRRSPEKGSGRKYESGKRKSGRGTEKE